MNREIEFNYVCKHSYMGVNTFYSKTLTIDQIEASTDVIEDIGNEIDVSCNCINESCNHCECNTIFDYGDFEIVAKRQFTGLHDCKGVKIYDGDIVHFEQDDFDFYFEVSFNDNGCFVARNHLQKSDFYFLDDFEYKVIGNIHQNSELLK